jgi:hypothetical protein
MGLFDGEPNTEGFDLLPDDPIPIPTPDETPEVVDPNPVSRPIEHNPSDDGTHTTTLGRPTKHTGPPMPPVSLKPSPVAKVFKSLKDALSKRR